MSFRKPCNGIKKIEIPPTSFKCVCLGILIIFNEDDIIYLISMGIS